MGVMTNMLKSKLITSKRKKENDDDIIRQDEARGLETKNQYELKDTKTEFKASLTCDLKNGIIINRRDQSKTENREKKQDSIQWR